MSLTYSHETIGSIFISLLFVLLRSANHQAAMLVRHNILEQSDSMGLDTKDLMYALRPPNSLGFFLAIT